MSPFSCLPCLPGQFCEASGLQEPTGACHAGYLCRSAAKTPQPELCPAGHFCVNGTINETACPSGTMRHSTGGKSLADCRPCNPGYYCSDTGLTRTSGECKSGYYCPAEAKIRVDKPEDFICPKG